MPEIVSQRVKLRKSLKTKQYLLQNPAIFNIIAGK